jgi:hypothetical protein
VYDVQLFPHRRSTPTNQSPNIASLQEKAKRILPSIGGPRALAQVVAFQAHLQVSASAPASPKAISTVERYQGIDRYLGTID